MYIFLYFLFWLIVAGVVAQLAGPIGTSVSALRVFKAQTWVHALRVISLTVLCATLIPVHDLMGGAWALLGSGVVLLSTYAVLWSFCVRNLITKHAKP